MNSLIKGLGVSVEVESQAASVQVSSADNSLGTKLLPGVLSLIAGSVDVISFLGLGGLFTAHITGNLVILTAHVANGDSAQLAPMLSVPMFMLTVGLARLLASGLESIGFASLRPLLLLQFFLLMGFLILCIGAAPGINPDGATAIVAGMLGVAAMGAQNALVQISLKGAPATAVMTTNITRFTMDLGTVFLGRNLQDIAIARKRAKHAWPAIIGFTAGCGVGAVCEAAFGLWSLTLPASLALVAVGLSFSVRLERTEWW